MASNAYDDNVADTPSMGADEPAIDRPIAGPDEKADFEGMGRWLVMAAEDPKKCAKEIVREFERQDPAMQRRKVFWDRNVFWYWGYVGVRALPQDTQKLDYSAFRLYVPLGTFDTQPPMPRAKLIAERQTAHLFADQPMPDPEPASDSDGDRDAAEFAKRVLLQEAGEAGLNYQAAFCNADLKASIFGSSFIYTWTDPTGGGMDQESGQWQPKLRKEILTGLGVRFLPETATGIENADGVLMLWVRTLGQLRDQFPALRPDSEDYVGDDAVLAMVQWRNQSMNWVLPWYAKMGYAATPVFTDEGKPADSTLVGCVVNYYAQNPAYPKGCYIITGADCTLLHAGTWVHEYAGPDGQPRASKLDIPLAQFRQYEDVVAGDPYGSGLVQEIGPADEIINTVNIGGLDHIDRFLRPNMLVPIGSRINPDEYVQRLGMPMEYNAGAGQPFQEEIGPFDPFAQFLADSAVRYQDQVSALGETAQGTELPNVTSGKQANIVIQQADVNLSGRKQRSADAVCRQWRIMLQQVAAFFPTELRLKYTTDDGAYTERAFETASLTTIRDIKIAVGTFSQMSPAMKVQMAVQLSQIPGVISSPAELQRILASGVQPLLGLQDDPVVQRVRGQLAIWKDGPDEQWMAQATAFQEAMQGLQAQVPPDAPPEVGQQFIQQTMGQMGLQPPPSPFDDVPSDHEQDVAVLRHREIRRVSQTKAFWRHPEPWRMQLVQALETARRDAGIMTVQEQQQAQAAQQQAAQQAEMVKVNAETAKREDEQDFKREERGASAESRVREKVLDKQLDQVDQPQPVGV